MKEKLKDMIPVQYPGSCPRSCLISQSVFL
ncbi:hypothetical protein [Bacillus pseudomycoides]